MVVVKGATGREVQMGFDKQGTWGGTPTTLAAGDGFYAIERGIERDVEMLPDDSAGFAWLTNIDRGNELITGGPPQYLRFDNTPCIMFMALAMGSYTFAGEQTASQGDYLHQLRLSTYNNGLFGTLAWKHVIKGNNDFWEIPSYKPMGFTIEGTSGDLLRMTPIGIGNKVLRSGVTNDFSSLTTTGVVSRILFNKLKFELGDAEGDAFGTQIYPSAFSFSFDRNANPEHLANSGTDSMEPEGKGQPTINISLTMPEYGHHGLGEEFVDDWFADQNKELKISYTGSQIGSGTNESFIITIDNLFIDKADPKFSGPDRIPNTVPLTILDPSTAALPFEIDVTTDTITTALWT